MASLVRFNRSKLAQSVRIRCGALAVLAFSFCVLQLGCGGNGKFSNSQKTSAAGAIGGTATFSNVQTSYWNWQGFGQIAPTFEDCPAPCPESTWNQVYGVSSPSKSGQATEFQLNPNMPEADVLFTTTLVGENSPYNSDADHTLLPAMHHFTYDTDFYLPDASVANALEFDISVWMNGIAGMTFGTECNYLGDRDWDIWDNSTEQWIDTQKPCKLHQGWHHVTLQFKRESDNSTTYEAIVLDETTYSLNWSYPAAAAPDGWWGLAANYQMDSDRHGHPLTTYLDNLSITYQP